jgi:MFS family permease
MVHSLLPVFVVGTLGASAFTLGLIDGAAEAMALAVRAFSGVVSDAFGKRKALAVAGYALGALSKPLFAVATAAGGVLAARLIDRIGKGIRGAPRDALVADIAPPDVRGAAFGLRQSLDTVGAFLGPLLAVALMWLWAGDVRAVFWVAVVPGLAAVALLYFGVTEPERRSDAAPLGNPLTRANLRRLPVAYWTVVAIGAIFMLARFSEAFLVLRAIEGGLPATFTPLVLVAMNLVYSAAAFPFGKLSDTLGHGRLLAFGLLVLLAADLVLASGHGVWQLVLGIVLWGLHMGVTQGLLARMVADAAPPELRGTAFGLFYLASGATMLASSALAGWLWDRFGASQTFLAGAALCVLTLVALLAPRLRRSGSIVRP